MSQTKFQSSTLHGELPLKIQKQYSLEDIQKMTKPINKNSQFSFNGWSFCSIKNLEEFKWIQMALRDTLNFPEAWGCEYNNFGAILKLQKYVSGNNCEKLRKWYGIPIKYEYRNAKNVNCIVDANNNDQVIIPLTAEEILDVVVDLNKNRKVEDIYHAYDFHHQIMTIELLEKFKELYDTGKLNKLIRFICSKSNELGGFNDYGVSVIRNRLTSQYIFDSRKKEEK